MDLFKIIFTILSFGYSNRKDLLIDIKKFYNSEFGKISLKVFVIASLITCIRFYYLISLLMLFKFQFSQNGQIVSFCSFIILNAITLIYFNSAFHNLFFTKKKTYKPFTIA